jgi:hypothetical protein
MESIKEKRYIIFNKHNGIIFSQENDKAAARAYNPDHFLVREIELSPTEYFFGNYETGQVYNIEEKPLVREDELEEKYYDSILSKYSPVKQLIAIFDVLAKNENLEKTADFEEIYKFIKKQRCIYKEQLKVVSEDKESFNFISIEEIVDIAEKRFENIIF